MRSATDGGAAINIIAAVDRNWAIGRRGGLLVSIPGDLRRFRQETMGRTVVLGRKTLRTLPQGMPLQGRRNLILSRDRGFQVKGGTVIHSLEELAGELEKYPPEEVWCIGGESVYRLLLPWCDVACITKIDHVYEADAYFPNLDLDPEWEMAEESEEQTCFDISYTFLRYERRKR